MPEIKPRYLKSLKSIDNEPQRVTPKMISIIYMDLAGKGTGKIAEELGMTAARVSQIKGCPMYQTRRGEIAEELKQQYMEKAVDRFVVDPVQKIFKDAAKSAAIKQIEIMNGARSEFVALNAADKILENAGYKSKHETHAPEIKVETKIFNRFIEVAEHANARPVNHDRFTIDED